MNYIKRCLLAALVLFYSPTFAQTCVTTDGVTTCTYSIPDDGYAIVPIPFGFPFYGRTFTHSLFFDNGVVSFYSPQSVEDPMRLGGQSFYATPLNDVGSQYFYSIMPLWTDLLNYTGSHTTETDGSGYLKYNWNNVSQWGNPNNINSFSLRIEPSGSFGITHDKVNIQGYPVIIGSIGNGALGEVNQHYYQPPGGSTTSTQPWTVVDTGPSCVDPLSNVNCPGYADAYLNLQCSSNPLYSTTCMGYEVAYFNQQCSLNPLYNQQCSGYADAYYVQQCAVDPLYDSGCTGYEQAYFTQQCSLDGLYSRDCPNYATAYAAQQALTPVKQPEPIVEANLPAIQTVSASDPVEVIPQPTKAAEVPTPTQPVAAPTQVAAERPAGPPTTRQALAERRLAAARQAAVERSKNAQSDLNDASSLEAQMDVQNVLIQAMGYTPGFEAYTMMMPDGVGYAPFTIYNNQTTVDNARVQRGLTARSDALHQQMVDSQYGR